MRWGMLCLFAVASGVAAAGAAGDEKPPLDPFHSRAEDFSTGSGVVGPRKFDFAGRDRRPPPLEGLLGTELVESGARRFNVSIVTPALAERLFRRMAAQKDIPFRYPEDGCYARAHEMAQRLGRLGIETGKIFVTGSLEVPTLSSNAGKVNWWYHVAPVVRVRERSGKLETYVFDPSLFDRPVTAEAWKRKQLKAPGTRLDAAFCTSRYAYVPGDSDDKRREHPRGRTEAARQVLDEYREKQRVRDVRRIVMLVGAPGLAPVPFPVVQTPPQKKAEKKD